MQLKITLVFFGSHITLLTHPELAVTILSVLTTCASLKLHSFPSRIGAVGDLKTLTVEACQFVRLCSLL